MLHALQRLQRLLGPKTESRTDSRLFDEWAEERGHRAKRVRHGDGRVVEFEFDGRPGRMEWGPPQRAYIHERELRVRLEAGLPANLEMLLMSRRLAERLETQAYQTLVRDHQTGIDATLPEEVRWLSMLEKVAVPSTAASFLLKSSSPAHAVRWLEGDLLSRVSRAGSRWLGAEAPLVVMTLRGRVYVRTEASVLDEAMLDGARGLAEAAVTMARVVLGKPHVASSGDAQDTTPAVRENLGRARAFEEPQVEEVPLDTDLMLEMTEMAASHETGRSR